MRDKKGQFSVASTRQIVRGSGGKFNSTTDTGAKASFHTPMGLSSLDTKLTFSDRLRSSQKEDESQDEEVFSDGRLRGNFIINISLLERNINCCFKGHARNFLECEGDLRFDQNFRKRGPGMLVGRMICSSCTYKSAFMNYFEEAEVQKRGKGRLPTKVGIQLQVASSKQPISNTGLSHLFAACDIAPGTVSGMQKSANKVLDRIIEINEGQLAANRKKIKETMAARTGIPDPPVLVESDAAYNNPIKGRSFYQPGTQVCQPVFCAESGLNLPIEMATASKLCSCAGGKHGPDCRADFPLNKPMGNAEYELAQVSCKKIMGGDPSSSLNIKAVITDGDAHIYRGFHKAAGELGRQLPKKADCTRHLTKRIGRNLNKADLVFQGTTQHIAVMPTVKLTTTFYHHKPHLQLPHK